MEAHLPVLPEEPGYMVGSQTKVPCNRFSAEVHLEILLYVEANRFVASNCLGQVIGSRGAQQPQTGMKQRFHQQVRKWALAMVGGKEQKRTQYAMGQPVVCAMDIGFESAHGTL